MKHEYVYKDKTFSKREIESPEKLADGFVRIKPIEVGVCGSDLYSMEILPDGEELRPGHEWIGEVIESKSDTFKIGDRVTSPVSFGCNRCEACLDGRPNNCLNNTSLGGKEIGAIRTELVLKSEQLINLMELQGKGDVLIEVAAVADQAFLHMNNLGLTTEKSLLIFGAGPVGLFCALKAQEENIDYRLIEIDKHRIQIAKKLGLKVESTGLALLSDDYSMNFEYIIDCAGDGNSKSGFWKYLLHFSKVSAKILIVGKYINTQQFNSVLYANRDLTIKWMRGLPGSIIKDAITYWKDIIPEIYQVMISHEFDLEDLDKAFELAMRREKTCKVVIKI